MDINQTLIELRELVEASHVSATDLTDEIAERFEIIDQWLSKGGFFPSEWDGPRTTEVNEVLRSYGLKEIS